MYNENFDIKCFYSKNIIFDLFHLGGNLTLKTSFLVDDANERNIVHKISLWVPNQKDSVYIL